MSIPDKPLELSIDPSHLSYDDLLIFYDDPDNIFGQVLATRAFLLKYSESWTRQEIGQLELSDHAEVLRILLKGIEELAVPLANETASETGPQESEESPLSGSSSDK